MSTLSNQELQYRLERLATVVADLTCMIDGRPKTLDKNGQDWFEERLKNMCKTAQDIAQGRS